MCCPVDGKVHINNLLLFIGESSICAGSRFPLKKYVRMTTRPIADDTEINVLFSVMLY